MHLSAAWHPQSIFFISKFYCMKTNLKLNNSLSFRALETQARKAAAIAAIKTPITVASATPQKPSRKATPDKPKKAKAVVTPNIDSEIHAIFKLFSSTATKDMVVKMEQTKLQKNSCKGIITVSSRDNAPTSGIAKDTSAIPTRYAFYASTHNPSLLGSVAIYGDNVATLHAQIQKAGSLFGYRVIRANIEMGRRQFVDVLLRF
jgi:hypothetical protein